MPKKLPRAPRPYETAPVTPGGTGNDWIQSSIDCAQRSIVGLPAADPCRLRVEASIQQLRTIQRETMEKQHGQ